MNVGDKIKVLREEKGMTLEEVGNIVGVGKSTVRKWETGMIANMRRDKIAKLAMALGTTPTVLMGWEEEPSPIEHPSKPAFVCSSLEKDIVTHYRTADPGTQGAVRKLLDVEEPAAPYGSPR